MIINDYFSKMPFDLIKGDEVPELKMLKTFAFNAYFSADEIRIPDVLNCTCYSRKEKYGIDGVYLNDTLEDNVIECVYSYYVNDGLEFSTVDVYRAIDYMREQVRLIQERKFITNKKSDDLLADAIKDFEESESKVRIILKVITNHVCGEKEKFDIVKDIEKRDVSIKRYIVSAGISFGDDLVSAVDANVAPYDYVADGKLIIDKPDNILKYGDDSFVCNITAQSLKKLWSTDGQKGLLAMNLRYYIKAGKIDDRIEESILFNGPNFWYLNNGIIIVCDDYYIKGNSLHLKNFSIVNGGQTTRMIGCIPFDNDFFICCKVVKNTFETPEKKNIFISQVAEASNTQKPIKAKDIIANKVEQRNLKTLLSENKIFIEIKRGEKYDHSLYVEPWQKTKNNELAQDLYSFVYMEPGPARNAVSNLLQNEDKYDLIFKNHAYTASFLRDLLFVEKAFREYKKDVTNNSDVDATKKGLVKNGMFYALATLGYILKLGYNTEYFANIVKNRYNEALYNLYSPELAFVNGFIKEKQNYSEFRKTAFEMFDFIFTNLIVAQFKVAKESNAGLAYSNWMKTNTGFNAIRTMINSIVIDTKQNYIIDGVLKFFKQISKEEMNLNIDTYVDYCKKNKKITAKTSSGFELNSNDEQLRNDLMIFRLNHSSEKGIKEANIFTDKQLDKLVVEKPLSISELKKIISPTTVYFCGETILKIIEKYL